MMPSSACLSVDDDESGGSLELISPYKLESPVIESCFCGLSRWRFELFDFHDASVSRCKAWAGILSKATETCVR